MQNYNAKLSDFGLARDGPTGDKSHVSTRVMGTYGYAAPEYLATGTVSLCGFLQLSTDLNVFYMLQSSESIIFSPCYPKFWLRKVQFSLVGPLEALSGSLYVGHCVFASIYAYMHVHMRG